MKFIRRPATPFKALIPTNPKPLLFLITFLLSLIFITISNVIFNDPIHEVFADAFFYWHHATYGFDLGTGSLGYFSLHNYPDFIRGYFIPFLFYIFSLVGNVLFNNGLYGFFLFNSVAIAFLASIVIPSMFAPKNTPHKPYISLIAATVFSLLLFLLWRWIFFEPLADFFALFFAILSVKLLKMATDALWIEKSKYLKGILLLIAAGLCAYAAYNARTIYILFFVATIAFITLGLFRQGNLPKKFAITLFSLTFFISGFIIAGIPEATINYNHHNERSIMVITEFHDANNLFIYQLIHGVQIERFETYIGDVTQPIAVRYFTPAGQVLTERYGIFVGIFGLRSYLRLLLNHPFDMLAIYWRSFINGLTPLYTNVYVRDLNAPVIHMIITSFVLWFIGGISFFQRLGKKTLSVRETLFNSYIPYWFCVLIPCLFIIPSAMEVRFMLPLHIFLYSVLCYKTDYKAVYAYCKERPLKIISIGLIIFAFWLTTISSTLSNAQFGAILIH